MKEGFFFFEKKEAKNFCSLRPANRAAKPLCC
jgi:hypothetical protein